MLTHETVQQALVARFGENLSDWQEPHGLLTVTVKADQVVEVLRFLFDSDTLRFRFLTDICGVHYPENTGAELAVIYHLHALEHNVRLRLKAFVPVANPVVPSATAVFASANWMERETFDFYGVIFQGHPNLTRILNVDDMDYHPLRKEYPLEDPTRRDKVDAMFGR